MSCKVLLTGISGWIGKHIAIKLLKEGHHVVGTVRNENLIEPTKQTLKSKDTPVENLSFAVLDLLKYWRGFNPKYKNAFAYFTEISKRGFAKGWNKLYPKKYHGTMSIDGFARHGKSGDTDSGIYSI